MTSKRLLEEQPLKITDPLLRAKPIAPRGCIIFMAASQSCYGARAFESARSRCFQRNRRCLRPCERRSDHEQFFLIDLALSQIESERHGRRPDDQRAKDWEQGPKDLAATLEKIKTPEIAGHRSARDYRPARSAARPEGTKQMAIGFAGGLSVEVGSRRRLGFPPADRDWFTRMTRQIDRRQRDGAWPMERAEVRHLARRLRRGVRTQRQVYDQAFKIGERTKGPRIDRTRREHRHRGRRAARQEQGEIGRGGSRPP